MDKALAEPTPPNETTSSLYTLLVMFLGGMGITRLVPQYRKHLEKFPDVSGGKLRSMNIFSDLPCPLHKPIS
jgi:hypothetical protein